MRRSCSVATSTSCAEDGYPAPVRRSQTSTLLAASKTVDVLVPTGTYGLFDRMARAGAADSVVPPPDTTPDLFSFTDLTNAALSTLFTSNAVTINGIASPAPISVMGGQYSVGVGAFTSAPGFVSNADSVRVQQTSAATSLTATNTILNVGGVADTFTVTTVAIGGNPVANPDIFYITTNNNPGGNVTFPVTGRARQRHRSAKRRTARKGWLWSLRPSRPARRSTSIPPPARTKGAYSSMRRRRVGWATPISATSRARPSLPCRSTAHRLSPTSCMTST